jgi:hypothetical protein
MTAISPAALHGCFFTESVLTESAGSAARVGIDVNSPVTMSRRRKRLAALMI